MQFYCPNCQQLVEQNPETTVTTKFNQTAYKAHCPQCDKDVAVYGAQPTEAKPVVEFAQNVI